MTTDRDAAAHAAIVRLQGRYADIATRMAWDEMAGLMTDDASFSFDFGVGEPLEISSPAALAKFGARACAGFDFYVYTPLNCVTELASDTTASGRAYALEVGVDRASGAWLEFYGSYRDDYAVVDGQWRFARRRFQTMASRTDGVPVVHTPTAPP